MSKKQTVPMSERLAVPVPGAGELSSSGKDTIYRAINEGELKSLKVGRKRLILVESLKEWLHRLEDRTQKEMGFDPTPNRTPKE